MSFKSKLLGAALLGGMMAASFVAANPASAQTAEFKTKQAGDIVIRARAIAMVPDEDTYDDTIGSGEGQLSNDVVPEVDFSYFLTDNIALELIAATTQHDLDWSNPSLDAGSVRLLPPTLTLQYHFMPESRWSPYVGAGINYTFFYDSKPGQFNSVKYDDGFGYAFQAGFDYAISGPWSVNLDVKKIFLDTDVSINNGANTSKAHLDPWVFGLGIGYRF
ncbi:MAG: OmpW family protein [Thalassospira sp.]|uniref:OmpW/AlkL family protein n=1 Tax=Thalassospira TaxID=168934 RepID=UPI0002871505|nr:MULTISPECIES: OmpW family outer membrane protein [Thalassospira]EKF09928.1 OmpW family protein [Thalassospira profundimaris WP0211]MBO6580545.1 OmpW family protein [Thalassospira sp.]MBO6801692.1 OmpW family protein [Thalassospira sp.]MBO6817668.1 OmpW family protein [Thalassospira sp.]MBO6889513.1 OmpW family protein [Thalassospira sp.]